MIVLVCKKEFSLQNMKEVPFSYNALGKAEISHKLRNLAESIIWKEARKEVSLDNKGYH